MSSTARGVGLFAAAGLASGVLSTFTEGVPLPESVQDLLTTARVNPQIVFPGFWFGIVTGAIAWQWGARGIAGAFVSFLVTSLAWHAAVHAGLLTFDHLMKFIDAEEPRLMISGLIAGAVGALGVVLGLKVSVVFPQPIVTVAAAVAIGALAGVVLHWSMSQDGAGLLLYALWQTAVAACLVFMIARRSDTDAVSQRPADYLNGGA